jgi:RHS repeat-associated protein
VTIDDTDMHAATVESGGTTKIEGGTLTVQSLTLQGGSLTGSANLKISSSFEWVEESTITGSGTTTLDSGGTGEIVNNSFYSHRVMTIEKHKFVNDGTIKLTGEAAHLALGNKGVFENFGIFDADKNIQGEGGARFVNRRVFRKIADPWGNETTEVSAPFENYGTIKGKIDIQDPIVVDRKSKYGKRNKSALSSKGCSKGDPVNCLTGNFYESQTDIAVGGRGVGLNLMRTYNAQAAAAGERGSFGYGWSSSFNEHLTFNAEAHTVTVVQEEGSTVTFTEEGGKLVAPEWTQDEMAGNSETGYTLTMNDQTVYKFTSTGALESVKDRNGNTTTLSYNEKGQLATITDPAGRKIKLAYNGEGYVESATDPMGHVVKYAYESGNLVSVTMPGESSPRWKFKYDASHRIASQYNALGGETKNSYDEESRVVSQIEPSGATIKWEYEPFVTKVTEEATGAVTLLEYTSEYQLAAVTRGYGTEHATREEFTYNERGEPITRTDGRGYTTSYEYNEAGDETAETSAEGHEIKWSYNSHHQVTSETNPGGETTSIEYDEHGNPIKVSRPAPEEKTQVTHYEYNADGEMTAMIDPLERKWGYGYDEAGDRTSETDPEGDKTTWGYNEDSRQISEVSPAGNVEGGKPGEYTTSTERNAQGLPVKVTQPEGQETLYEYNADGDQTNVTDANGHKTMTTYDSEDQPVKVTEPSGAKQETEYNGAGEVVAQIDGNKHATKYVRNVLGEVIEVINPLEQKTKQTYDADGNLATVKDALGRTATYSYSEQDQPTKIAYSEEATPTVEYEYNSDGQLMSMHDGTGTTSYSYNQLGQLTETKDGYGEKAAYAYDLAGEITQITYPNGKTVKDSYDKAGRLSSLTDWLSHTISFAYNPNSQPTTATFPETSGESDHYTYNRTGQLTQAKMLKGSETLAQLAYKRDDDGQLTKETQTGLPGEASTEYAYTSNEQLESAGGTSWEYDPAGNPTKNAGATATFNAGDELTKDGSTSYAYNKDGQRTNTTPETGPATTYAYNQAGNLTSVKRPEEGSTPKIEDSYTYDGNDLRTSETIGSETKQLTWQLTSSLPLLLSNGTNSYIYGPEETPIEQINNTSGEVLYLHHDQQGSTRLITGSTGKVEGSYTYGPYGETTGHTGTATTPLGYDGQYTSSDTGLIYLRAREYDPKTAQFLSRDPLAAISGEPYSYAGDNPLTYGDPSGLSFGSFLEEVGEGIAGWGDTITFGGTEWVREQLGDNNIDACSGAYQGGGIAGLVTGALIPGEDDAEAGELGVEGVDDGELATTPEGRPYSAHYLNDTGPVRNIPGSVVDETITQATETTNLGDRTVYYDAKNNVTVVQSNTTGKIMSVRQGEP